MLLSNICILQTFPDKDLSPAFLFQYQAQLFFSSTNFFKKQGGFQTPWKWNFGLACCSLCVHKDQAVTPQAWRHGKQSLLLPLFPMWTDPVPPSASSCTPILAGIAMKVTQTEPGHFPNVWSQGCSRTGRGGGQEALRLVSPWWNCKKDPPHHWYSEFLPTHLKWGLG